MTTSSDAEQYALKIRETARLGWMALALTPEMGPTRIAKAVARLGAAERVFEARSEEHTSESSHLGISYAVFCLKKKKKKNKNKRPIRLTLGRRSAEQA